MKKKLLLVIPVAAVISALAAAGAVMADTSTMATVPATYHVMIMTHLCDKSIKNAEDFENMENGRTPVDAIANDVLHCPTTGLPDNAAVDGTVASPRTEYSFSVNGGGNTATLESGMYEPHKLCESDIGIDVNGDGEISTSTCLDISHYDIPVDSSGSSIVKVTETQSPAGYHMGALRWTPPALDGNNDSEDLAHIDTDHGRIDLNMAPDKDGMVMLHVYQFADESNSDGSDDGSGDDSDNG